MIAQDSLFLIVDDSVAVRALIKRQLAEIGYSNSVEAKDGIEAFEKITVIYDQGREIHLILCDWNMPRMTGLELLAKIKSSPRFRRIPFLMCTSENEVSQVTLALSRGASDYLIKPITAQSLAARISAIDHRGHQK